MTARYSIKDIGPRAFEIWREAEPGGAHVPLLAFTGDAAVLLRRAIRDREDEPEALRDRQIEGVYLGAHYATLQMMSCEPQVRVGAPSVKTPLDRPMLDPKVLP